MNQQRDERLIAPDAVSGDDPSGPHATGERERVVVTPHASTPGDAPAATGSAGGSAMPEQGERERLSAVDLAAAQECSREPGGGTAPVVGEPTQMAAQAAGGETSDMRVSPLFSSEEAERFHARWADVQTGFVDEPRRAVEQADGLVAEVIERLTQVFAEERGKLEQQWARGTDASTEDLRIAMQRYRSFFERLLSAQVP